MRIAVLNGANLDMLEHRDPALYGGLSLSELETKIYQGALERQCTARCRLARCRACHHGAALTRNAAQR